MSVYTKRVQAVLTEKQHQTLLDLSTKSQKPLSVLIREAIEQVYLKPVSLKRRQVALEELLALDAPVADWEQMEAEIIQGDTTHEQ
ncbi:MAG: hypothetical protein DRI56_11575 [Chloroflexota bacterium]|nr:MAG: hypothetical protein DRI56_11575 [Chloroflexota bacterium]